MNLRCRVRLPHRLSHIMIAGCVLTSSMSCTGSREAERPGPPVAVLRSLPATSTHGVVSCGSWYAAEAGARILAEGGNAIDAAVTSAFVLAVADPADSGLGGISLALIRLADGRAVAIDGASTTPAAFDLEKMIAIEEERRTSSAIECTAVPTTLVVLAGMARLYGTQPIAELIQPAIDVAESGYLPTWFQITAIWRNLNGILEDEYLANMVLANGTELPRPGEVLYRPDLARSLRLIRDRGPQEFTVGSIAKAYERDIAKRGGWVTMRDLASARAREQMPDRTTYRGYDVISCPSPGSGASVVEAMNLLASISPEVLSRHSVDRMQMLADVFRIVMADQHAKVPDPNIHQALRDRTFESEEFTNDRSRRLRVGKAIDKEDAPPEVSRSSCREPPDDDEHQTTQLSVIDRWGNAVSMTSTLGNFYGVRKAVPGYGVIHNNLLNGTCPQGPNWAYVSDMAPTIVARDGRVLLVLGSAGSSRISTAIATVISNMVDRGMTLPEAIEAPRTMWRGSSSWSGTRRRGSGSGRRTGSRTGTWSGTRRRSSSGSRSSGGAMVELLPPITMADVRELKTRGIEDVRVVEFPSQMNSLVNTGAVNAVHLDPETGVMTGVGDPRRQGRSAGASH